MIRIVHPNSEVLDETIPRAGRENPESELPSTNQDLSRMEQLDEAQGLMDLEVALVRALQHLQSR